MPIGFIGCLSGSKRYTGSQRVGGSFCEFVCLSEACGDGVAGVQVCVGVESGGGGLSGEMCGVWRSLVIHGGGGWWVGGW